jgi:hypothetical protein
VTTGAKSPALAPEDEALLERLAARVVELRMEIPAILTLEGGRPLTFLASQAMLFFEPIARALFRLPDYRRLVALVERRETVETLIAKIEARADDAHRARRAAAAERRARRAGSKRQPPA